MFEIKRIIGIRFIDDQNSIEFKLEWKGYPIEDATWEPESHLFGCDDLIKEFQSSLINSHDRFTNRKQNDKIDKICVC